MFVSQCNIPNILSNGGAAFPKAIKHETNHTARLFGHKRTLGHQYA